MSEFNPYASPDSAGDVVQEPPAEMVIASQGQRFVNMLIDQFAVRFVAFGGGFAVGIALISSGVIVPESSNDLTLTLIVLGISLTLFVGYYTVMELTCQRTLGKLVSGTRVVNIHGGKPSFGQILGRSFARFIPFEPFSFLGGKNPVGWHDSLSGTRVVKVNPSSRDRYLQNR